MKRIKTVNKLRNRFIDIATEFDKLLQDTDILTNEEHLKILSDDKIKLLTQISIGEKIDLDLLKKKYLNSSSDVDEKVITKDKSKDTSNKDELLNSIVIDKITYYYEPKENGIVYNSKSQIVGSYINKNFKFN
jgi:hypothetical protein